MFRINVNSTLFVLFWSWQLLFVVFVGLLLQTEVLSKPYQSQDVLNNNKQWFEEGEQKPSQTMNETKLSREKRQVTTLGRLCPSQLVDTSQNSPSTLPCVERILYCPAYDLSEFQCKKQPLSFRCLESIMRTDYPRCIAQSEQFDRVIHKGTPNEERVTVMITTGCSCAWKSDYKLQVN